MKTEPLFTTEMCAALEADGEKLRQLTGPDHGLIFLDEYAYCDDCGCLTDAAAIVFRADGSQAVRCDSCRGHH